MPSQKVSMINIERMILLKTIEILQIWLNEGNDKVRESKANVLVNNGGQGEHWTKVFMIPNYSLLS